MGGGGGGRGGEEKPLENTPTWIVASVCSVIVVISFALERLLHFLGKVTHKPFFHFSSLYIISTYVTERKEIIKKNNNNNNNIMHLFSSP